uniref:Uncharacterized protein n=1 Tax=Micrurus spixii TaxID=129469 RepID=A0A2D4ND21_9SAUR
MPSLRTCDRISDTQKLACIYHCLSQGLPVQEGKLSFPEICGPQVENHYIVLSYIGYIGYKKLVLEKFTQPLFPPWIFFFILTQCYQTATYISNSLKRKVKCSGYE